MADVFISYKKERVVAVAHLAAILEAHGYTVWFDVRGLPFGPSFGPEIEKALREAAVTLVLWCSLSKGSKWVQEEASLAQELGRYLPAHMEPNPAPLGYRNDQAINLTGWDGDPNAQALDALFDELEQRTGKPPVANRRTMREIEQRWTLARRPNFVGVSLETGLPSEDTLARVFGSATAAVRDTAAPKAEAQVRPLSPSARVWKELTGSQKLADFDHFLAAFPNAPEAEACRAERAALAAVIADLEAKARRAAEFEALPFSGFDPTPFDAFVARHVGTMEAFLAAKCATEVRERIEKAKPDEKTRKAWELEVAVSILTGQSIPADRAPFIRDLRLHGSDDALFESLRTSGANLASIYQDPSVERNARRLFLSDLSSLKGLSALQTLDLSETQVSDLAPLKGLSSLRRLDLSKTKVSDLVSLKGLSALQTLVLRRTQVRDLTPLKELSLLGMLDLSETPVSDLTPLQGLSKLRLLSVRETQVKSLAPLKALSALGVLDLGETLITNLDPIEHVGQINLPHGGTRKGKRAP